jgi:hypothetical protein
VSAVQTSLARLKQLRAPATQQLQEINVLQSGIQQLADQAAPFRFFDVVVPWWFIMVLAVIVPALWIRRYRLHRRAVEAGLCVSCGYDLRATPARCPECGAIPTAAKGSAT